MKLKRKLACFLALSQLVWVLSACGSADSTEAGETTATDSGVTQEDTGAEDGTELELDYTFDLAEITDPIMTLAGLPGDTVVATAGDYELTAQEMLYYATVDLDEYLQIMAMMGGELPWGLETDGETYEEATMNSALELALFYRLVIDIGKDLGFTLEEDPTTVVEEYVQELKTDLGGDEDLFNYAMWQAVLTQELLQLTYESYQYYDQIYLMNYGPEGVKLPSDEAVLEAMEEGGYYFTKHILLQNTSQTETITNEAGQEVAKPLEGEELTAQLEKAQSIAPQLEGLTGEALEEKFDELMHEMSEDVGADGSQNCVNGYYASSGQMVAEYEAGAKELENWEVSEVVESTYGYHVILRMPMTQPDETVRTQLITELEMADFETWVSQEEIVVEDALGEVNLQEFYDKLTSLRMQTNVLLEAAFPTG